MLSKAVLVVRDPAQSGRAHPTLGSFMLERTPPQLLPVANRPLLLHALDAIETAGLRKAAVVADRAVLSAVRQALAERTGTLEVELVDCEPDAGLSVALGSARDFILSEPFLLHLGDSLQKGGLGPLLDDTGLGAVDARVLTREGLRLGRSRLVEASRRPLVESIHGKRGGPAPPDHAGVYVLGSQAIDVMSRDDAVDSPTLEPYGLLETLGQLGGRVERLGAEGGWRLGHELEGWLEGNRMALERLEADPSDVRCFDTDVQGNVAIHKTAEIRSSVIRGPAVIGPMTRLTDAYVGPYSSIGSGVLIEAAEIEHSIIMPGASIRYLGGRLEASIIGPRARVFRDFRLPKALRLSVGEAAEVGLA